MGSNQTSGRIFGWALRGTVALVATAGLGVAAGAGVAGAGSDPSTFCSDLTFSVPRFVTPVNGEERARYGRCPGRGECGVAKLASAKIPRQSGNKTAKRGEQLRQGRHDKGFGPYQVAQGCRGVSGAVFKEHAVGVAH